MTKYDKELDTRTEEYEDAMKPARSVEEREREQERERERDRERHSERDEGGD